MPLSSSAAAGINSTRRWICNARVPLALIIASAGWITADLSALAAPSANSAKLASGGDGATLPPPQPGYRRGQRKPAGAEGQDITPPASIHPTPDDAGSKAADKGPAPADAAPGGWQGRGHHHGGGLFGGPLDLSSLNLTDEQKQTIRQLRSQNAPKARELRRAIQAKRAELRTMMFDPNATDDAIKAKRKELRAVQEQMEDMVLSDFLAMRNVLTPEQKKKLPEVMPNRAEVARRPGGPPAPAAASGPRKKMVEGTAAPLE